MGSLEDAEDMMGDITIEDIKKKLPMAARAVEFGSTGGRNRLLKRYKHIWKRRGPCEGKMAKNSKLPKERCPSKEGSTKPEESFERYRE